VGSIRIPEPHRVALAKLRQLSDENIEAIISALKHQTIVMTSGKDIMSAIAPVTPNLGAAEIENISDTLFSLYIVRADADVPVIQFASDVSRALREGGEVFSEEQFSLYTERLVRLLSIEVLSVTSKALNLETDHAHALSETKILTDVRPVFGASVDDPPIGFVITHTLKIEYHDEAMDHRRFYVALDDEDLLDLKGKIERAQKKASSLMSLMGRTGIRNLLSGKEKKS